VGAAQTAFRLVVKKGRLDGRLRRPGYDQATVNGQPWKPIDADQGEVPILASNLAVVVLDRATLPAASAQALAPEATAMGLMAFLSLPIGVEPKLGDVLETAGDRYSIVGVDLLKPADEGILYTLSLKAR
jgi:hypothetical protein